MFNDVTLHNPGIDGLIHVTPNHDLRPHELSPRCWCRPTPDDDETIVIVHHALDGREAFESGDRLPS